MRNVQKPRRESRRVAIRRRTEDRRTNRGESILLEARVGVWYPERHASAVVGHVVPFLVVFSTIFRGVPLLTRFSFSFSSQRLYKRLKRIELADNTDDQRDDLLRELDAIEADSKRLPVPKMYLGPYFELRQNIHDLRDRLSEGTG